MSQRASASSAARAHRPTLSGLPRAGLTLVPPLPTSAPRAPFVVLVGTLLTLGLGGLLYVHTALAEDSFRLHDLKERSQVLADREQALQQEIDATASPRRLAARALELGMVRSENPAFIRISDGRILGRPKAGVARVQPPAPVTPQTSADVADRPGQPPADTPQPSSSPSAEKQQSPVQQPPAGRQHHHHRHERRSGR
jgi:hypothetical protein